MVGSAPGSAHCLAARPMTPSSSNAGSIRVSTMYFSPAPPKNGTRTFTSASTLLRQALPSGNKVMVPLPSTGFPGNLIVRWRENHPHRCHANLHDEPSSRSHR
jgi:hypothetical protein